MANAREAGRAAAEEVAGLESQACEVDLPGGPIAAKVLDGWVEALGELRTLDGRLAEAASAAGEEGDGPTLIW